MCSGVVWKVDENKFAKKNISGIWKEQNVKSEHVNSNFQLTLCDLFKLKKQKSAGKKLRI